MNICRLRSKKIFSGLSIWLTLSFSSASLYAHPHNWINLKSDFILNDDGRLIQINQRWEFDVYYSMITYTDAMNEHGSEEKGLHASATRIVQNLESYNYFSSLKLGGVSIDLREPGTYKLSTIKKGDQMALVLEMGFDIEPGMNIKDKELQWQVYDPTYYIAMNHWNKNMIRVINSSSACNMQLDIPEPSDDVIEYALSLDRNQKDTGGLGVYFAEKVIINC